MEDDVSIFDDPDYVRRMEELQEFDNMIMELWENGVDIGDTKEAEERISERSDNLPAW